MALDSAIASALTALQAEVIYVRGKILAHVRESRERASEQTFVRLAELFEGISNDDRFEKILLTPFVYGKRKANLRDIERVLERALHNAGLVVDVALAELFQGAAEHLKKCKNGSLGSG